MVLLENCFKFSFEHFRPLSDRDDTQTLAVCLTGVFISVNSEEIFLQNFTFRVMARTTVFVSNLIFEKVFELSDTKTALN